MSRILARRSETTTTDAAVRDVRRRRRIRRRPRRRPRQAADAAAAAPARPVGSGPRRRPPRRARQALGTLGALGDRRLRHPPVPLVARVTNPQWQWDVFAEYFFAPSVINGLWLTLALTVVVGRRRASCSAPCSRCSGCRSRALLNARGLVVHLVLPVRAARRADPRLVQPRLPLPDARPRHAVHHRLLARRVPDDDPDHVRSPRRPSASRCTRPRTRPRSSGPASSRSTRASSRRPARSACPAASGSSASRCRRPRAPSCRTRSTRSSGS